MNALPIDGEPYRLRVKSKSKRRDHKCMDGEPYIFEVQQNIRCRQSLHCQNHTCTDVKMATPPHLERKLRTTCMQRANPGHEQKYTCTCPKLSHKTTIAQDYDTKITCTCSSSLRQTHQKRLCVAIRQVEEPSIVNPRRAQSKRRPSHRSVNGAEVPSYAYLPSAEVHKLAST